MLVLVAIGLVGALALWGATYKSDTAPPLDERTVRGVAETMELFAAYPTTRISAVRGRAVPLPEDGPEEAPLSGVPSVWWRLRVLPLRSAAVLVLFRRFVQPIPPIEERSARPFVLQEGDHRVRVEPDPAVVHESVRIITLEEEQSGAFSERRTPATRWIQDRFPNVRAHMAQYIFRGVDLTEWSVPVGADTIVTGWLAVDEDTGETVLRARCTPLDVHPVFSVSVEPEADGTWPHDADPR